MDFGYELSRWSFGVHTACVAVSLAMLPAAFYYGIRIKHRLIYLTPSLCFALAFENLLLIMPTKYLRIEAQRTGWIMNACVPPLFLTTCFETGYVVHKHRSVKYLGINFDEGKRVDTTPCSWLLRNLVRLISLAILFMGLVVNFVAVFPNQSVHAGMSGYLGLAKADNAHFYVSLVPQIVFSILSIIIGALIARYGAHSTLLIRQSLGWNWMLLGAIIQCAGQFPAQEDIYPATSMLGQTFFLLCIILSHREVLRDLNEAARITEFLRRQKAVQIQLAAQRPPGLNSGGTSPHHPQHLSHHQQRKGIGISGTTPSRLSNHHHPPPAEVEMVNMVSGASGGKIIQQSPYDESGIGAAAGGGGVVGNKPPIPQLPGLANGHPREGREDVTIEVDMIAVHVHQQVHHHHHHHHHHRPRRESEREGENCERGIGGSSTGRSRRGSSTSSTASSSARAAAGGGGAPALREGDVIIQGGGARNPSRSVVGAGEEEGKTAKVTAL